MTTLNQHNEWVRRITQNNSGTLMASASKDETVIIWNMERIRQNINKMMGVDQTDFILTMIDDHEHVIDCIRFANEAARKVI
jgi:WD40 repeat protein